jgi:hypothetical protein
MKTFAAVLAAALVLGAVYAVAAPAGQQGVSPAKVAKLAKQVKKLKKAVHQIQARLSCLNSIVPLTEYGDYVGGDPKNPTSFYNTTGLDVTAQGDKVGAFFQLVKPSCVSSSSAQRLHTLRSFRTAKH